MPRVAPVRFESLDASLVVHIPDALLEYEPTQDFSLALNTLTRRSYAFDGYRGGLAAKAPGEESLRFGIWGRTDEEADELADSFLQASMRIGTGKLWIRLASGVERWAYARARSRPAIRSSWDSPLITPVSWPLVRLSDWYAAEPTTFSQALSATPTNFVVTNPGTAVARDLVLRLRANAIGGFTNPAISNAANAHSVASTRDATGADDELRFDNAAHTVKRSTNDGATYADDYSLVTIGDLQAALLELAPGDNLLTYTDGGTPDAVLEGSFYAAYH